MPNSADPDQLASSEPTDLDLHCLQKQGISWFSRKLSNSSNAHANLGLHQHPDETRFGLLTSKLLMGISEELWSQLLSSISPQKRILGLYAPLDMSCWHWKKKRNTILTLSIGAQVWANSGIWANRGNPDQMPQNLHLISVHTVYHSSKVLVHVKTGSKMNPPHDDGIWSQRRCHCHKFAVVKNL